MLHGLLEDRTRRALYVFPTKALAQDQYKTLSRLIPEGSRIRHGIFDGDTPSQERADVRRSSQLLITNPDMLHLGILPNHRSWYEMLRGLRYVVIDEAHVYRGVFGSHVANVIRRLRRLCQRFGGDPQFILCSATIANPGEHAEGLVGLPFHVVGENGSPYGGKDFVLWNPPMLDMAKGGRHSTNSEAALIFAELLRRRVRTLTFVRSRRAAELLYVYARDQLRESDPDVAKRVAPYRASYLPEDRQVAGSVRCQLPAGGPASHRARPFRGPVVGAAHYQRHGAGDKHRRPGCDCANGLSRQHSQHMAAGGA